MMRWMDSPVPGGMDGAILAQVAALREQMSSASVDPAGDPGDDPGEMDGE